MAEFSEARDRMVETQLVARGIADPRVIDAMRRVPRERFVLAGYEIFAYDDSPLPIEEGQTISQPYIVAYMIEMAEILPTDRVLEVGTGSGYAAAVMSLLAAEVYTIERHASLAAAAQARLFELGYRNVTVRHGDGTKGWPAAAPYAAILVAAGAKSVPEELPRQLASGGRLVIPVGGQWRRQRLLKIRRRADDSFAEEDLGDVAFVPLVTEGKERRAERGPEEPPDEEGW